jgi:hypothetical protein
VRTYFCAIFFEANWNDFKLFVVVDLSEIIDFPVGEDVDRRKILEPRGIIMVSMDDKYWQFN